MASIISGLCNAMRPLAKELIKNGLVAIDAVTEFVAETGEQIKDLVAEAKADLACADKEKTSKDETIPSTGSTVHGNGSTQR
jgi:hypothetical protein